MRADEGALRTFNDTTDVGDSRCRPRLVDKDWHAICQAIFQGVEGSEWKIMYCNDKELHEALKCVKSGKTRRPGALVSEKQQKTKEYISTIWATCSRSKQDPECGWFSGHTTCRARRLRWQTHWNVQSNNVGRLRHQQRAMSDVRCLWPVLLFGLRIVCQQNMMEVMSSEDEDDITSSDVEAGDHNARCSFLGFAAQDSPGMLVEGFLEDEELARTALSCHLSLDLFCQDMNAVG